MAIFCILLKQKIVLLIAGKKKIANLWIINITLKVRLMNWIRHSIWITYHIMIKFNV